MFIPGIHAWICLAKTCHWFRVRSVNNSIYPGKCLITGKFTCQQNNRWYVPSHLFDKHQTAHDMVLCTWNVETTTKQTVTTKLELKLFILFIALCTVNACKTISCAKHMEVYMLGMISHVNCICDTSYNQILVMGLTA